MPGSSGLQPLALAFSLLYGLFSFTFLVAILVIGLRNWPVAKGQARRGLWLGAVIALLQLPLTLVTIAALDPRTLMADMHLPELAARVAAVAAAVTSLCGLLLGVFLDALRVPVSVLAGGERPPFPLLLREASPKDGLVLAAAIGVGAGVVSELVFLGLGVEVSGFLLNLRRLYPSVDFESASVVFGLVLPATLGMALAEELVFRGVVQRWLRRLLSGHALAGPAAIAISSLVWACGHAVNAEPMGPKLVQIFLLGLAFGWLADRYSVEAAMAGHVALNIAVVAVGCSLS